MFIQSNLDNLNPDFSKLPDFFKTSDSPENFRCCLLLNYYRFFEKFNFSNNFAGPDQRNSY